MQQDGIKHAANDRVIEAAVLAVDLRGGGVIHLVQRPIQRAHI